ncbi:MAG: hypothetical protein GVY36_15010 [Verrucomicrobia bacterium]|jgi:hypothetical protein|nr:hypothetical protein [Verrucomicrobiota bacterium]
MLNDRLGVTAMNLFHPFLLFALGLLTASQAAAAFILPDAPAGTATEFAWWDGFTDPETNFQLPDPGSTVPPLPDGEGNPVNRPEADNTDARLYQTGTSTGFITSTQGIYSFAAPLSFLIHDVPAFQTESVLLQTRSIGGLPDLDNAAIFYRESATGPLLSAGAAQAGDGFLLDGGNAFAMWEWDLSAFNVYDLFITFNSIGTSMSLQEVQLDTFDAVTNNLGVALRITTNANFATVGEIEHNRLGESEPRASYQVGDVVELTPVIDPIFEHVFVGWLGDLSGDAVPATLTIDEDPLVQAVFAPLSYEGWTSNNINPFITNPSFSERSPADADPDADGLTNLLEYALGTAPEAFTPPSERPHLDVEADGSIRFAHCRQMAAQDIEYRVEVSPDLVNWHHNGDGSGQTYTEQVGPAAPNGDGTETVTVQPTSTLPTSEKLFFRLRVLPSQP